MFPVNMENNATITPSDFTHLITLALLALDESNHPIAKNSHLTVEKLQKLSRLCYFNEYSDIIAKEVQITVKHVDTEAERQAMLHDYYLADD